MKLEVGKSYLNRKGEVVKIVENDGDHTFPFNGDDGGCYTAEGFYWDQKKHSVTSSYDLVAPTSPAPTITVTVPKGVNVEIKYGA